MLNHDTCEVVFKIAPEGASAGRGETFSSRNRLYDPIYAVIFFARYKICATSVVLWISHLCKYFRCIVDFSTRAHVRLSLYDLRKKEREKKTSMKNRTRRVPEDFAFIARKYFFASDGRRTHTRRAVYSVDDPLRARSYSDGTKIGLD